MLELVNALNMYESVSSMFAYVHALSRETCNIHEKTPVQCQSRAPPTHNEKAWVRGYVNHVLQPSPSHTHSLL